MFKPHAEDLICVRELYNPRSIVTSSRSGSIKIWSLELQQLLVELFPAKEESFHRCKSIKGIEVYTKESISYILCWAFSTDISVWLVSSSLTKPFSGILKGHLSIVEEVTFLSNYPVAISIDAKCSVRVWDVAKKTCMQTWKY